ncbi:hypothetical protein S58_08590 [Bradyrhizobium oligotrophicum S58]|uniref:Methyltransferase type 11 domain-containing protein n=1 Tax=Bradyrhizobium oligotrophicum S58 TaxID=1245469 RepID=M4ZKS6_9BRAD|nr:DUF268 domain-containing protein [Bradyrhizobium oligotrophicum]BAM86870.1 hypothetical protein S58_08590 [Bradyrhizobium oligotrophicum S58]
MQSLKQYIKGRLKAPLAESNYKRFLADGNPPWKPGYDTHKIKSVTAAINDPAYDPYKLPDGFGWRLDERIVEYPWFMARLPAGKGRLLDAGSTLNHAHVLGHPKLREKTCTVSTLAPEQWSAWQWGVSYVYEDLRESCFRDAYFDWIACISTIEHVGLDNTMLYTSDGTKNETDTDGYVSCLMELRRMLKPGGVLFLSMPFGRRANHGWFQIFDAEMVDRLVERFAPQSGIETIYRYKAEGWTVGDRESAKDATYFDIHKQNTYDDDYAAASRAVVCLELTK